MQDIASRQLSFDHLIRKFIRDNLSYKYLVTEYSLVRRLETYIQSNGIDDQLPFIKPKG
jgi:hypothetical protein